MAQAELTEDSGRILVSTTFSEKELIKSVPGSGWKNGDWTVPLSWGSCVTLRGVFGQRLEIGPRLVEWATHEREERVDPANEIRMVVSWANGVVTEPGLYPFQDVGVEFLYRAKRALLADEMGTGKTTQTIRAIRRLASWGEDPFPVCVICPNTVKRGWLREWAREAPRGDPNVQVFVIEGSATKRRKIFDDANAAIADGYDVAIIINFESVRGHSRLAPYGTVRLSEKEKMLKELNDISFKTVVVDEAHRMKDPKSKQTRACWSVQHGKEVKFVFGLTGTPIASHPGDLWAIMHGIAPLDYPTRTKYVDRYCMQGYSPFGGLNIVGVMPNTKAEFEQILDPRMRSMPKELVLPFLPPRIRPEPRYVPMSPKQKKAYKQMEEDMLTRLDDGTVIFATNSLTKNTRLLQFSSASAVINEEGEVRLSEPSSKLDELDNIIDEMNGEPLVVVAESLQLINLAQARMDKRGITYRMVTGDIPAGPIREQNIEDFQEGKAQVMLMTIKAGGVGITLTRAGVIVFLQRSWSMIDNKQCEDRVHRIGSEIHDKIVIIDMIAADTVEESQIPRLHEKLNRLQEIVRHRETLLANGNVEAVAALDAEKERIEASPLWGTDVMREGVNDE
jgi:SNF2 family DNA or RNA helicase